MKLLSNFLSAPIYEDAEDGIAVVNVFWYSSCQRCFQCSVQYNDWKKNGIIKTHFQYVRFYSEIIRPIYNQRNELIQIFHECNFHSCIAEHAGRMGAPIIIGGGDKGIRVDQYGRTLMLYLNPTS